MKIQLKNPTSKLGFSYYFSLIVVYILICKQYICILFHRENVNPIWLPQIVQKFRNLDDAWTFWVDYGGHAGFEVRKRYANESKYDGKITSCRFVCAKEGYRARDKRDHNTKNPRAETRTGCPVRIGHTLDRVEGTYEVLDLVLAHNHVLHLPQTFHLLLSQRRISEVQAFEIEAADV